ncbi:MAG: peptidoglycan-binding protein [Leptolyngbya sp. SIO1D8]|nr:peptidoglycan-binding protein [Leptolyngbya sp. SIO1D8]
MIHLTSKTNLKSGSSHHEVLELQQLLSQRLRPIPLTGHFDYETEIAVKSFQSKMFLRPDGIVGFLTWQALYSGQPVGMPTMSEGCHGTAVAAIQELLAIDFYYVGNVDGIFGPKTRLAVQRFQADYGMQVDGTLNTQTWWALSEI